MVDLEGETLAGEAEPDEGGEAELLGGDHCEFVMEMKLDLEGRMK